MCIPVYFMTACIYLYIYICLYYTYTHSHTCLCPPGQTGSPSLTLSHPKHSQLCSGGALWGGPCAGIPLYLSPLPREVGSPLFFALLQPHTTQPKALPYVPVHPPKKRLLPYFNTFCCFYYPPAPISFLQSPLSFLKHSPLKVHHIHLHNDFTRCDPQMLYF